jgi:hypothetical protein
MVALAAVLAVAVDQAVLVVQELQVKGLLEVQHRIIVLLAH